MNTYAYKTNFTLYANAITGKRNSCPDTPKRLYKNFKPYRNSNRKNILRRGNNSQSTAESIIELFSGTIVTEYTTDIEWGALECFTLTGN